MFGRKKQADAEASAEAATPAAEEAPPTLGPRDISEVDLEDGVQRVDLESLVIDPSGFELRLQVDESTKTVQSVFMSKDGGLMEMRAFAAPRNGSLWDDVRPEIAEDVQQRGGTVAEAEGRYGTQLVCEVPSEDGSAVQQSRVLGIEGERWLLRVTLIGVPATDTEVGGEWLDGLSAVSVRRGEGAMPAGGALPLTLPDEAVQA